MAKGASIRFESYRETVPKILEILKLPQELKKYDKIVLKPFLTESKEESTPKDFTEAVLKFCMEHKNPVAEVFIAEGADGCETTDLFDLAGYQKLAEEYGVGLIDLNNAETEETENDNFLRFHEIKYPKILAESFLISLPKLSNNEELSMIGSLSNMLGAFPADHYSGFFSKTKNKIRKWPIKYSIHDIIQCKMPELAIVDASEKGVLLAGLPLEIDKQSAKLIDKEWKDIPYLKLLEETLSEEHGKIY